MTTPLRQPGAWLGLLCLIVPLAAQDRTPAMSDPGWVAPASASARPNPLAAVPAVIAGGAKLFQRRCEPCHGPAGTGSAKAPTLTTSAVLSQSDGALFWKVSGGNVRRGMPSFSVLPDAQRWQLVLYLRSLPTR